LSVSHLKEPTVRSLCPSPLENLLAFGIAFLSGAMSVISIRSYLRRTLKKHGDGGC
jgi:hypothetical protein